VGHPSLPQVRLSDHPPGRAHLLCFRLQHVPGALLGDALELFLQEE
jgi:hypothetical protein